MFQIGPKFLVFINRNWAKQKKSLSHQNLHWKSQEYCFPFSVVHQIIQEGLVHPEIPERSNEKVHCNFSILEKFVSKASEKSIINSQILRP